MERHDGTFWNVDVPPHAISLIHIVEVHLKDFPEYSILNAQETLKEKKLVIGL